MSGKVKVPAEVRRFVSGSRGIEAVIQRVGLDTWDLLLIDGEGNWTRVVVASKEEAEEAARDLGIEKVHDGWDDEDLARRMNRRDHWNEPGGQRRAL